MEYERGRTAIRKCLGSWHRISAWEFVSARLLESVLPTTGVRTSHFQSLAQLDFSGYFCPLSGDNQTVITCGWRAGTLSRDPRALSEFAALLETLTLSKP